MGEKDGEVVTDPAALCRAFSPGWEGGWLLGLSPQAEMVRTLGAQGNESAAQPVIHFRFAIADLRLFERGQWDVQAENDDLSASVDRKSKIQNELLPRGGDWV